MVELPLDDGVHARLDLDSSAAALNLKVAPCPREQNEDVRKLITSHPLLAIFSQKEYLVKWAR